MPSMVILVLYSLEHFERVVDAWRDAGAPAVTILDSVGTRELEEQGRRDDLPLMPSIRDLLRSDDAPRKTIFTVLGDKLVDDIIKATEEVMGDLREPHKGILVVLPVTKIVGYRES